MTRCLLIETKDHRKFLTHEENLPKLIEFGKTFGAELSVIKTEEVPEILDLRHLAPALCDSDYSVEIPEYQIIKVMIERNNRPRKRLIKQASVIRDWIREELLAGRALQLAAIAKRYKKYDLSIQAYANHYSTVRGELVAEGYKVEKIGHGIYKLFK